LFSGTPAGAGGVSFCTGADYYQFNYNWVCGNMSTGDGGGLAHVGFSYNGDIEHNWILFNQSTNPTIATNGGGIVVMGAAPDGLTASGIECGSTVADLDCAPGLPDGTGPNLVINANLILGNSAASGSGGGLRLQSVNGTEIAAWPNRPANWNSVKVTNNIIVNNVAGWDGGGVSLQDALKVDIINNTIASNDTTASSGVLFNTLGAPLASAPGATNQTTSASTSAPQPAGLVSMQNSANLTSTFVTATGKPLTITCPNNNPGCSQFSNPYLANDLFWQNRAFYIGVGNLSNAYQQNIITMYNAAFSSSGVAQSTGAPVSSQPGAAATTANGAGSVITGGTGACVSNSTYWDIGVRGDSGPGNHSNAAWVLAPSYSALTNVAENTGTPYAGTNQVATNPDLSSQYCNGSRTPPEAGGYAGWQVPPGISDATVPNPVFNLSPAATVDEGNNWVNISWGPLALTNPVTGNTLGNYAPAVGSPVIDVIPPQSAGGRAAPNTDFFGNPRPDARGSSIDIGAVEYQQPAVAVAAVTGGPVAFGNVVVGTTSTAHTLTLNNTGGASMTGVTVVVTAPFTRTGGTCAATLAAGASCTITVAFSPTSAGASTGTATITGSVTVTGSPVALSGTGVVAVVSARLTPATWSPAHVRNCPGTGIGVLACDLDPAQVFTLTNTGNVALTGIAQGVLGGVNASEYAIARMLSNCGPAGGGQLAGDVTLAPGATCTVTVQFKPLTAQPTGIKNATVSVTDLAGTQTSNLSGNAQ
jgi:Abnormal spindle-like microcephaly-assoc'd, ASPM-SPD-2-Hydin